MMLQLENLKIGNFPGVFLIPEMALQAVDN
jgi:hypothetical protein